MDKKLMSLIVVFMLFFAAFLTLTFLGSPDSRQQIRAQNCFTDPSRSYVFADPLELPAGQRSIVTVFVRNEQGDACPGKPVSLTLSSGSANPAQTSTDADGAARFQFSCTEPAVAEIEAIIEASVKITQKVTIACN